MSLQKRIRSRCSIVDLMWGNLTQSFSEGITLVLSLLSEPSRYSEKERDEARSLIHEAESTLEYLNAVHRSEAARMTALLKLLLDEEARLRQQYTNGYFYSTPNLLMVAKKVVGAVRKGTIRVPDSHRNARKMTCSHLSQGVFSPHISNIGNITPSTSHPTSQYESKVTSYDGSAQMEGSNLSLSDKFSCFKDINDTFTELFGNTSHSNVNEIEQFGEENMQGTLSPSTFNDQLWSKRGFSLFVAMY